MPKLHEDWGFAERFPSKKSTWSPADGFFPITTTSPFGHMASNPTAQRYGTNAFQSVGGANTYTTLNFTATTTGTSAAAALNAAGGGVLLTCGSDSTFNTNLQSVNSWIPGARTLAPASDVGWVAGGWVLQSSDITTVGFECGFGTSAVDPATTDYTDVIGFKMGVGAGTIIGKVRGDAGTVANSATLYTATAATDLYLGFVASLGQAKRGQATTTITTGASSATQTVGSTTGMAAGDLVYIGGSTNLWRTVSSVASATSVIFTATVSTTTADTCTQQFVQGFWYAGANYQSLTRTAFTANQLIQLARILSTPLAMFHNMHAKGSAGTPTILFRTGHLERDSF